MWFLRSPEKPTWPKHVSSGGFSSCLTLPGQQWIPLSLLLQSSSRCPQVRQHSTDEFNQYWADCELFSFDSLSSPLNKSSLKILWLFPLGWQPCSWLILDLVVNTMDYDTTKVWQWSSWWIFLPFSLCRAWAFTYNPLLLRWLARAGVFD